MSEAEYCPKCGTRMLPGKEPLRVRGTYVGSYSAMTCPNCKYFYFTEDDYDLALKAARSLGLAGPTLPILKPVLTVPAPMISYLGEVSATNDMGKSGHLMMNVEATNSTIVKTERLLA